MFSNLDDDRLGSIAASSVSVTAPNGFELYDGSVDFISYTPAGDPYAETFGTLGSATAFGSIADTFGLTFEMQPNSFSDLTTELYVLDALTLGFSDAYDLRTSSLVSADLIQFGAQFSMANAVPEPDITLLLLGAFCLCLRGQFSSANAVFGGTGPRR